MQKAAWIGSENDSIVTLAPEESARHSTSPTTRGDLLHQGPWAINSGGGNAVYIDGTKLSKSFVIYNLTVAGNQTTTDQGIVLNHINPSGAQS
jgi:hypothetical protein